MTQFARNTAALLLLLSTIGAIPAAAQTASPASVTLQATGSFERGGEFTGTFTINRFEVRDNEIVAVGFVKGVLRRGGRTVGTVVAGERAMPVRVSSGGILAARNHTQASAARLSRINRIVPVQAEPCPVVQIALGPFDFDVLGVLVSLDPIVLDLAADPSQPLGGLVCQVLALLNNVVGLVGVLNNILALLTGLLGGLTGGL
jgi:hypothetical protein